MSPLQESRLELRLFGDDGEGGAIGAIRADIKRGFEGIDQRVSALEARNIASDAVGNDVDRRSAERRWRLGVTASVVGAVLLSALDLIRQITNP